MVVWLGGVVFCWWVLLMTSQVSDELFQISAGSGSGTGMFTAGSVSEEAGAEVGEARVGHCFGK